MFPADFADEWGVTLEVSTVGRVGVSFSSFNPVFSSLKFRTIFSDER